MGTSAGFIPSQIAIAIANSARLSGSGPATCNGPVMSGIDASAAHAAATSAAWAGQRNSSVKNRVRVSPRSDFCTSICGGARKSVAYINDVRTITAVGQAFMTATSASAFIRPYSVIAKTPSVSRYGVVRPGNTTSLERWISRAPHAAAASATLRLASTMLRRSSLLQARCTTAFGFQSVIMSITRSRWRTSRECEFGAISSHFSTAGLRWRWRPRRPPPPVTNIIRVRRVHSIRR